MNCEPHWTAYLSALLTPVVAALGLYIAWRQWRTARNKLRFELFQRRMAIYESVQSFLASIMQTGSVKADELQKYTAGTRDAKWLFGKDVADFLRENVRRPAIDLQCLETELQGIGQADARANNIHRQRELKDGFIKLQEETLDAKLQTFLRLYH